MEWMIFEMSLALGTPSVVNVETLCQNRRQDLHSLRLGQLASHDLGYRTWLESLGRAPYVTPNEDGSTGRTASPNGDAGRRSADDNAGNESADGDLRDEFPWFDTEYGSADREAASGSADREAASESVDKDEDQIRERHSDNSPTSSYRSLSQAGTAAPSTTTPTPITLLTIGR